jgi:hypothetical protein
LLLKVPTKDRAFNASLGSENDVDEGRASNIILWNCRESSLPTRMQGISSAVFVISNGATSYKGDRNSHSWYPIVSQIVIKALLHADDKFVYGTPVLFAFVRFPGDHARR